MSSHLRALSVAALASVLAPVASAQWGATVLAPAGFWGSTGKGGVATQQAGSALVAYSQPRAAIWNGSAASFVNLHPLGAVDSQLEATDGVRQAGWVTDNNGFYAGVWSGSAATYVGLHPAGAQFSRALGVDGAQVVGWAAYPPFNQPQAALWAGAGGGYIDLNPASATASIVWDVANGVQCGSAVVAGSNVAALWTGSPGSFVSLNPSAGVSSHAYGTDGVQQVGSVISPGVTTAALWSGTAASFVSLNPWNAQNAEARAVDAGEQVGWYAPPTYPQHACIWSGTATSIVDLHEVLPVGAYLNSQAHAIWHSGGTTYVLGTAMSATVSFRTDTILWKKLAYTTYCTSKTNSLGCAPTIQGSGNSSATNTNQFLVYANQVRSNENGLLLYGMSGRLAAPFAGGTMCVAAPRVRGPLQNSTGNNLPNIDCTGQFLVDVHALRAGSLSTVPAPFLSIPGTLVNCQFWARDAGFATPNKVQLSNALEFEIGP